MIKLKELREEKGIYQKDMAKVVNKTPTCICDWEKGNTEPNIEDLIKLADFFDCSVDYLLGREDDIGIVSVMGVELNDKEKKLLDCYRSLSVDGQTAFIAMAENVATMYRSAGVRKNF